MSKEQKLFELWLFLWLYFGQKLVLRKQRLKITRTLAAKHDLHRMWSISPRPQITVSNHKQWNEAHFLPVHKITGLAVTSWDLSWIPACKFSLCFLPLRNLIILKKCRKQFAIMAVVGKVNKVEIDEKLREWKRLIHKAMWLNTLLMERREYLLLR